MPQNGDNLANRLIVLVLSRLRVDRFGERFAAVDRGLGLRPRLADVLFFAALLLFDALPLGRPAALARPPFAGAARLPRVALVLLRLPAFALAPADRVRRPSADFKRPAVLGLAPARPAVLPRTAVVRPLAALPVLRAVLRADVAPALRPRRAPDFRPLPL
jgi:hypothetical protein